MAASTDAHGLPRPVSELCYPGGVGPDLLDEGRNPKQSVQEMCLPVIAGLSCTMYDSYELEDSSCRASVAARAGLVM